MSKTNSASEQCVEFIKKAYNSFKQCESTTVPQAGQFWHVRPNVRWWPSIIDDPIVFLAEQTEDNTFYGYLTLRESITEKYPTITRKLHLCEVPPYVDVDELTVGLYNPVCRFIVITQPAVISTQWLKRCIADIGPEFIPAIYQHGFNWLTSTSPNIAESYRNSYSGKSLRDIRIMLQQAKG